MRLKLFKVPVMFVFRAFPLGCWVRYVVLSALAAGAEVWVHNTVSCS